MSEPTNAQPVVNPSTDSNTYWVSILLMTIASIEWLAIAAVTIGVVPVFKSIFNDFGAQLPYVTVMLVNWNFAISTGSLIVVVGMILAFILRPRSSVLMSIYALKFGAGFAVVGLVIVALFGPLPELIDAVSK